MSLMAVQGLSKEGIFQDVSFEVRKGEVLGFAGLIGSGRTDVALAVFGIEPADSGQVTFEGTPVKIRSPEQAMQLGIAYVTEDRRQLGLIMPMSIVDNMTLPTLRRYLNGLGLARRKQETATAESFRERLMIRAPSVQLEVSKLSGGNQQKVMLSKWLNVQPKLLILDEPTRGIDVRAKAEVHHMISDLAQQGLAIILISSDLPEVLAMSDRVLVMREGRQMGIFDRAAASQEAVMTAAMGHSQAEPVGAGGPAMKTLVRRFQPEQIRELVLVVLILGLILFFGSQIENYFSARTFNRISASVAVIAVVAVGQTLVILTRNIDLSVGSIVGFTAYVVGTLLSRDQGLPPFVVVLLAIAIGGVMGGVQRRAGGLWAGASHHRDAGYAGHLPHAPGGNFGRQQRGHQRVAQVAHRSAALQRRQLW